MKTDLASSIGVAILGILISYFVCNLFIGPIEDVSFNTVSSSVNVNLTEPDVEVFNYKALNPTVEVYVGDCTVYNEIGECVDVPEEAADQGGN
ncbi:hypothetical protein IKF67_01950 [Candidatus Saccharibacteria bacterium]|nr:hypothetical protein [Candidatus Saccharibacteria bacterium]